MTAQAAALLSAAAVRERCGIVLAAAERGETRHFRLAPRGSMRPSPVLSVSHGGATPISPFPITAAGGISPPAASTAPRWLLRKPARPKPQGRGSISPSSRSFSTPGRARAGVFTRTRPARSCPARRGSPWRACGRCRRGCSPAIPAIRGGPMPRPCSRITPDLLARAFQHRRRKRARRDRRARRAAAPAR